MKSSVRSSRTILDAIARLNQQLVRFSMRDIARVSTYSVPTVLDAIARLEASGHIAVDRSERARRRTQPYRYTVLREMDDHE